MKPEHVVLITLHADPTAAPGFGDGGGTHAYVRELMFGLTRNSWRVTVMTRWSNPNLPQEEAISPRLRLIRLRVGEVQAIDKRLLDGLHAVSFGAARAALKDIHDAALLHSVYWNSGRLAMDLGHDMGIPFVHTVISNGWRRWCRGVHDEAATRRGVEHQVFSRAAAIFCVSRQERTDLIEHYGVEPGKVVIVGRPVASSFLRPCHDESGQPAQHGWSEIQP
jgi:glycosyltransferase involved in cell wall biosynthesis